VHTRANCDISQEIWGGRNQHVGLYESAELESMPAAARVIEACDLATRKLFSKARPSRGSRVIEFGSGFGGTARHAAAAYDVDVTCVDLSRRANEVQYCY
jgi:cyclopropane fatty-acyl-phospholipid synthase-like methyltransferase